MWLSVTVDKDRLANERKLNELEDWHQTAVIYYMQINAAYKAGGELTAFKFQQEISCKKTRKRVCFLCVGLRLIIKVKGIGLKL